MKASFKKIFLVTLPFMVFSVYMKNTQIFLEFHVGKVSLPVSWCAFLYWTLTDFHYPFTFVFALGNRVKFRGLMRVVLSKVLSQQ